MTVNQGPKSSGARKAEVSSNTEGRKLKGGGGCVLCSFLRINR